MAQPRALPEPDADDVLREPPRIRRTQREMVEATTPAEPAQTTAPASPSRAEPARPTPAAPARADAYRTASTASETTREETAPEEATHDETAREASARPGLRPVETPAPVSLQPGLTRIRRPQYEDEADDEAPARQNTPLSGAALFGGGRSADPARSPDYGDYDDDYDEAEEDDAAFMQPARPRDPELARQRIRALRQRGSGLSPAERAALDGDYASDDADEDYDEPVVAARTTRADLPTVSVTSSADRYDDYADEDDEVDDGPVVVASSQRVPYPSGGSADRANGGSRFERRQRDSGPDDDLAPLSAARDEQWELPDFTEVLEPAAEQHINDDILLDRARIIEDTLDSFGAPGNVVEVNPGPVITQFGVEPDYIEGRGGKRTRVKVQAIARLADDLALALAARSIRIEAPVPGKGFVGIEVPNAETSLVSLRDIMESREFNKINSKLRVGLGQSVDGTPVAADLTLMPHLLIAGTTGSGK
ncbi:MAG: hypothetical protein JW910_12525, partial [Anaerolineae bacterium]|nr:hypothetical protein [Anaerolineae bacterium]